MGLLSLLFQDPLSFVVIIAVILVVLSVHECSHALAGKWLGDPTAERMGRLTLNPLAHVDAFGFLALVLVGFGWGKPVPFNPYNLKYQRWGPTLVAAAGPASNFLMGIVFAIAYRLLSPALGGSNLLVFFLQYAGYLSFLLGLFNLIPIPPLDGSKFLLAILASEKYRQIRFFLEQQGMWLLIGLIVLDSFGGLGLFSALTHLSQGMFGVIAGG